MSYSDIRDDNQWLDDIRCGLIDIENEQQKTNELLGKILIELEKMNRPAIQKLRDRVDAKHNHIIGDSDVLSLTINHIVRDTQTWHTLHRFLRTDKEEWNPDETEVTVLRVLKLSKGQLMDIRNFGPKSLKYLKLSFLARGIDKLVDSEHWLNKD